MARATACARRAIYKGPKDSWDEPQSKSRGSFREVHDTIGAFKVLNTPFQISGAACKAQPYISGVGEDNDEILADLGYTPGEVERLRAGRTFG